VLAASGAELRARAAAALASPRLAAAAIGLVLAWACTGRWLTMALSRDSLLGVAGSGRVAREGAAVFVTIGDADLARYPAREPGYMDRRVYARAVDRLVERGASVIVLDLLFDRPSPGDPAADEELARAIARSGRVVLARCFIQESEGGPLALKDPIPPLAAAATGLGYVNVREDPDGVIRRVQLAAEHGGTLLPHIALAAVTCARSPGAARRPPVAVAAGLLVPGASAGEGTAAAPDLLVPTGADGRSTLDLAMVPDPIRIGLAELLDPGPLAAVHASALSGKIAVVGSTSPLLRDRHAWLRNWLTGERSLADGAWFIVVAVENILGGGFLLAPADTARRAASAAMVLLALILGIQRPRRAAAAAVAVVAAAWTCAVVLHARRVLVDAAGLTAGVLAIAAAHVGARTLSARQRLRKLNRELSVEIAQVRRQLDQASRAGEPAAAAAALDPLPGRFDQTFVARFLPDRYGQFGHLGAGGMGVVYSAYDSELSMKVALKVISPLVQDSPVAVKRFLAEGRTLERLSHPGLPRVTDIGTQPLSYFAMELIAGTPLDQLIPEGRGLPTMRALAIAIQVADVLGYVHGHGLVHRDVKPSNVMVLADDSVKLLDFGLVHDDAATALTKTGDVLGTLHYMAPEQFAGGKCSAASDVYSLGVLLCQMIAGELPPRVGYFHQPPGDFFAARPVPPPLLPALDASLSVEARSRPADGRELARKLRAALAAIRGGQESTKGC
jgi:CHASE2 domain-containing sensor protein